MSRTEGTERRCPVCRGADARVDRSPPGIVVHLCPDCGHRFTGHAPVPGASEQIDYHEQYSDRFLGALETTRRRQARRIVSWIRERVSDADALLDFGAGRGWLLEEARRSGFRRCAGAETSSVAVAGLRERGFEVLALPRPLPERLAGVLEELSFRPRVLAMLDVVEHFPPDELRTRMSELVEQLRPELLVIKVPLAEGLLFRTASALTALGVPGPLDQLYQLGTDPPHYHFFCQRSVRRFLEESGLELCAAEVDRDFEPSELVDRVRALGRWPRALGSLVGYTAALVIRSLHLEDAGIFFARPQR